MLMNTHSEVTVKSEVKSEAVRTGLCLKEQEEEG